MVAIGLERGDGQWPGLGQRELAFSHHIPRDVLDAAFVRLNTDENSNCVDESTHVFAFAELAQ